jgi:hypothetical protein
MRLLSVKTTACVAVVSAAGAGWCHWKAEGLRSEAQWLLARGQAQADEYARSFDDALAVQELQTFAERRAVLERAHLWQRWQALGVVLAVVAGACAWLLSVLRRLSGQLDEVGAELEQEPEDSSSPALPAPAQPVRR